MMMFTGRVGDREIVGTESCSFRVRERAGRVPRVFIRRSDRIEEWILEERNGELHLGGLKAVNQRRFPKSTVEVSREREA